MRQFDLVTGNIVPDADTIITDGFVAIRDGKVAMVGGGALPLAAEQLDARGTWIVPGVLEGQVHSGSQAGFEGLGIASRAAAAGRVTVMIDMPYDSPSPVTTAQLLDDKRAVAARSCHVDHELIATIAPSEQGLEAIAELIEAGAILFKFSTYEANKTRFPRIEEDLLLEAMKRIDPSGLLCGVHNQDQELSDKNIARNKEAGSSHRTGFLRRAHAAGRPEGGHTGSTAVMHRLVLCHWWHPFARSVTAGDFFQKADEGLGRSREIGFPPCKRERCIQPRALGQRAVGDGVRLHALH